MKRFCFPLALGIVLLLGTTVFAAWAMPGTGYGTNAWPEPGTGDAYYGTFIK